MCVCVCIYNVCVYVPLMKSIAACGQTRLSCLVWLPFPLPFPFHFHFQFQFQFQFDFMLRAQRLTLRSQLSALRFQMQFCANAAIKIESIMNLTLPPFVVHVKWIRTNGTGARCACSCPILVFAISIAWPERQILIDWLDSRIVRNFK